MFTTYICTDAPIGGWNVVDASGRRVTVDKNQTTTLRSDYATAYAAYFTALAGDEVPLAVRSAAGLDIDDDDNWVPAESLGFYFENDERTDVLLYFDGEGGGEREPTIVGNPDLPISPPMTAGQERRLGPFSRSRFGPLLKIHFDDDHTGLWVMAVRKEPI